MVDLPEQRLSSVFRRNALQADSLHREIRRECGYKHKCTRRAQCSFHCIDHLFLVATVRDGVIVMMHQQNKKNIAGRTLPNSLQHTGMISTTGVQHIHRPVFVGSIIMSGALIQPRCCYHSGHNIIEQVPFRL